MPSFSSAAFDTDAFSENAFDFGTTPAVVVAPAARGTFGWLQPYDRGRSRKEIAKDRERFGIPDEERLAAERVIASVAARQVARLERDAQKRFEELERELKLLDIEWESKYLDALNLERERLIDAELFTRFQRLRDEQEIVVMLMLVAAACG